MVGSRWWSGTSLPEEITEQIIARVGCTKSTVRCMSVCKSWYGLIKSSEFLKLQLSVVQKNCTKYMFCKYFVHEHRFSIVLDGKELEGPNINYSLILDGDDGKSWVQNYHKLDFPHEPLQVYACNGLICYNKRDHPECLYLWNPFIRRLKKLPLPPENHNSNDHHSVFKLWFDKKNNDYRVLRISYMSKTCTVAFYSLNTNSWKLITHNAPITTSFINSNRLAYVNGTFYWPALTSNANWILISLDIEKGIFREILTEWSVYDIFLAPSADDHYLFVLGYGDTIDPFGSLGSECNVFQVYDQSLKKLLDIAADDPSRIDNHQPLGFRNNGDLLLQDIDDNLGILTYSTETKEFKDFVPEMRRPLLQTIPFVETLALLDDAESTDAFHLKDFF